MSQRHAPRNKVFALTLHELLAAQRPAAEAFLAALIRVPSDNPPGDCAAHAARAAELLEALGFIVERHEVPAPLACRHGMVAVTNLIVRHRFGPGPIIALNAHGDVVPPGDGWTADPYGAQIRDGWIYGRGAAVSKSDIITFAFALAALRDSGTPLAGTVELHITHDEETGGDLGPGWLLAEGLSKPDLAIAAGFSYAVVNALNGCLHLEVAVTGRSAHAARPESGADALAAATVLLTRLYAFRAELARRPSAIPGIGAPQLTIGLIAGGTGTNVVPDRVTFRLDRRIKPEENAADAEAELNLLLRETLPSGISVATTRILLAEPVLPLPGADRLATVLCRHAAAVFGVAIPIIGTPLYADARHYAARDIPIVLYGAGPGSIEEANAHRADERVALADLHGATEVIARALAELLERDDRRRNRRRSESRGKTEN